ncbi:MAG: hypothetical protein IIB54_16335 [Planctomycetes bacterium]|nr:hypothetical protein [Planctomycetota bacterium]
MSPTFPGTLRRPARRRRDRFPQVNRPQPTSPINIISASKAASQLTIVFDQPVSVRGVPQYAVNAVGATPQTVGVVGPTTITIIYSADISLADEVTIPYEEPAVRNASGGFVNPRFLAI